MLINDHEPIEHRCPRSWSLGAAAATALAILVASGLRADATPAVDDPEARGLEGLAGAEAKAEPKGETLHYSGKVKDKDTGKPIAGAIVTVRRRTSSRRRATASSRRPGTRRTRTGVYSFTIPPEQVAVKRLYIELDVEHPDYATQAGFGYALSMIRKNEELGERPFFENIALRPAKPVPGRVETPDGDAGRGRGDPGLFAVGQARRSARRSNTARSPGSRPTTAASACPVTTPGLGVFWILPKDFAAGVACDPRGISAATSARSTSRRA